MEAQVCMIFPRSLESESFVLVEAEACAPGLGLGSRKAALGLAQRELGAPSAGCYVRRTAPGAAGHHIHMDSA